MTRGDQRDRDRAKAQARMAKNASKGRTDNLTPQQRREADAKALADKIAKKQANSG
ncbi:hypothetical protein H310_09657 [Aphanomyces invadans]|uniref:Small EDRK-rich factor-like N-terminal domain-containing protein n=1 Tax=Aphanomyces invadans TaxID=157072 RepID=A0A024TUL2_9STRA|nr:hypothetical protein H310_09657 [Aphanomyces invadans]ETV97311.1 hypothetical protein H310_09657 [Aphanomyces invadans]|eukprot:XP_008874019.1 hypothetical protein H310_09657 [Aphanomyces invadans]